MEVSPRKLNSFLILKLPSAWLCGVRVQAITSSSCETTVRHRWINQNPFNSLYFAVQAMAAELSTGALVMNATRISGKPISMLVVQNRSKFLKKATGKITFKCTDGDLISSAVQETLHSGEGQLFWMKTVGFNEHGEEVSHFEFQWSIKLKDLYS